MFKTLTMTVNGSEVCIPVDERESLTDALRNRLGLTSVKKGCEVGECGACTVLVDGEAVDSCIYLSLWAEGRRILTVEGLKSPTGELHPIQQAFIESGAIQCGFCTPGMIITAKALLDRIPNPTDDEIIDALGNNLCRCTGYVKIIEAVRYAARLLAE